MRDSHDPLCWCHGLPATSSGAVIRYDECECDLIAKVRADEREQANVYWRAEAARWRQAKDFTPDDARAELAGLRAEVDRLNGENRRLLGEAVYGRKAAEGADR